MRVRVTDNLGLTATASMVVAVANRLPVATFTHAPGSPNPREPVTMTSTSTDLDGTISQIQWDTDNDGAFDDGTGTSASRTFSTSGNKTVRLRATDNDGGADRSGRRRSWSATAPPTASFDYRPGAPIAEQQVTFFSTSDDPDKNIETVDWDLDGDGSLRGRRCSVARSYPAGSFNVSVRVTDTEGSFSIATQTIVVSAPPPATQAPQISSEGPQLRLLNPFPIVRIAGRIGRAGHPLPGPVRERPGGRHGDGPVHGPRLPVQGQLAVGDRVASGPDPQARAAPAARRRLDQDLRDEAGIDRQVHEHQDPRRQAAAALRPLPDA